MIEILIFLISCYIYIYIIIYIYVTFLTKLWTGFLSLLIIFQGSFFEFT